ncbi:hypothetical protein SAMN06272781_6866 [Streptomyces sp. 1222.2]|uniref:hypothetical protein n=1 Tax=Streptomyces sp. 1222.2 TaxID=1938833 RepID=UPI000BDABFFD|nr:hypothetical protein [Streptomyces sp. 1222.2]SOD80097.1 hypothetical protein SAMN06272781_6866 [Streptomyces sp. 1222.2]
MATPTKPRMPADCSDDLDRALQREARDQTPAHERVTCPVHLTWRDRCHSWH